MRSLVAMRIFSQKRNLVINDWYKLLPEEALKIAGKKKRSESKRKERYH